MTVTHSLVDPLYSLPYYLTLPLFLDGHNVGYYGPPFFPVGSNFCASVYVHSCILGDVSLITMINIWLAKETRLWKDKTQTTVWILEPVSSTNTAGNIPRLPFKRPHLQLPWVSAISSTSITSPSWTKKVVWDFWWAREFYKRVS